MQQNMYTSEQKQTESPVNVGPQERTLSAVGGVALVVAGLLRRGWLGLGLGALGSQLIYRSVTGVSPIYKALGMNRAVHDEKAAISVPHQQGVHIKKQITIHRPIEEVYAFWRDFANLPYFMQNVKSVEMKPDNKTSHWKVQGPAGLDIEWDAEIIHEESNRVIGWRSLENPYVNHAGSVRFKNAPSGRGTEIHVEMEYMPIAGKVGAALVKLLGEAPEQQIAQDLRRLKQRLEVGEVATTEGQPSGRGA